MKAVDKLFKCPGNIIGQRIYFVDIFCEGCSMRFQNGSCPEADNYQNCLLQIKSVYVFSVEYYKAANQEFCIVNGKYEFPMKSIRKEVFLRKYDAWLHMERLKKERGRRQA